MKTLKPYINFETLHIYWAKGKKNNRIFENGASASLLQIVELKL